MNTPRYEHPTHGAASSGPRADAVNHPEHYTAGNIECIAAIREALGLDGFLAFCRGNVLKYSWRADKKGKCSEDMAKAAWYATKASEAAKEMEVPRER